MFLFVLILVTISICLYLRHSLICPSSPCNPYLNLLQHIYKYIYIYMCKDVTIVFLRICLFFYEFLFGNFTAPIITFGYGCQSCFVSNAWRYQKNIIDLTERCRCSSNAFLFEQRNVHATQSMNGMAITNVRRALHVQGSVVSENMLWEECGCQDASVGPQPRKGARRIGRVLRRPCVAAVRRHISFPALLSPCTRGKSALHGDVVHGPMDWSRCLFCAYATLRQSSLGDQHHLISSPWAQTEVLGTLCKSLSKIEICSKHFADLSEHSSAFGRQCIVDLALVSPQPPVGLHESSALTSFWLLSTIAVALSIIKAWETLVWMSNVDCFWSSAVNLTWFVNVGCPWSAAVTSLYTPMTRSNAQSCKITSTTSTTWPWICGTRPPRALPLRWSTRCWSTAIIRECSRSVELTSSTTMWVSYGTTCVKSHVHWATPNESVMSHTNWQGIKLETRTNKTRICGRPTRDW